MRLIGDAEVRTAAGLDLAVDAIQRAFRALAAGEAAIQPRMRTVAGAVKLSTMAAVLPGEGVAGAKVYTTVDGRFRFLVLLFDAASGAPLACMEADAFTEVRTAATSVAAALALADPASRLLAVFGTGLQARAHALALARRFPLAGIRVVSRGNARAFCAEIGTATGVPTVQADARAALAGAGLVVTATRAKTPVVHGADLAPGAFVAAVGATLPDHAELDADAFRRAATVVVEWGEQSFAESGDLLLAEAAGALDRSTVVEMATVLGDPTWQRPVPEGVTIFKSVGIALEDVAVAAAVWRRLATGANRG
jgi:ornithine cyclodeaminase